MDAVLAHEQRDTESGLRDQDGSPPQTLVRGVQDRARVPPEHVVVDVVASVELEHLPDLLLERHATEEVGHALGDGESGVLVRELRGQSLRGHHFVFWFVCGVAVFEESVVPEAPGEVADDTGSGLFSGRGTLRTAVTASFTLSPFFFIALARSPAERRRGLTYSSMPKLMSESATPMIAMQSPAGTYHHHSRGNAPFCWAQNRIVPSSGCSPGSRR